MLRVGVVSILFCLCSCTGEDKLVSGDDESEPSRKRAGVVVGDASAARRESDYVPAPIRTHTAWFDEAEMLTLLELSETQRRDLRLARERLQAARQIADRRLLDNRQRLGRIMREGSPGERRQLVDERSAIQRDLQEAETAWASAVGTQLTEEQLQILREQRPDAIHESLRPSGD